MRRAALLERAFNIVVYGNDFIILETRSWFGTEEEKLIPMLNELGFAELDI